MKRYYKQVVRDNPVSKEDEKDIGVLCDHPISKEDEKNIEAQLISKEVQIIQSGTYDLIVDPGLRPPISSYNVNDRDKIRRAYLQKGPFQPRGYKFPWNNKDAEGSKNKRRFISTWFDDFDWIEYSTEKDAAYCLHCYLFPDSLGDPAFISQGFVRFKEKKRLQNHTISMAHNHARKKSDALMNEKTSIIEKFATHSTEEKRRYKVRLNASIAAVRHLLKQGLSFRGHDESEESLNRGNFLELLQLLAEHNDEIASVVLKNAPGNVQLTASSIQKDIVSSIANETAEIIAKEIGNDVFTLLVDESRDVSCKEQMAIVLRYINQDGDIIERFLGLVHVSDTRAKSLKAGIIALFSKFGLSISQLRGQGYDGASNMSGEFNGLKALLLNENPCAFYVHCFAHQLQLVIISIAQNQIEVSEVFDAISEMMNIVGGSCRRLDKLRELEFERVRESLRIGSLESGSGLNQARGTKRPCDTRWGSNYYTLLNFRTMFSSIRDVLQMVSTNGSDLKQRTRAFSWYKHIQTFDFVFLIHLMEVILGKTNDLSVALQKETQDIINAMKLVKFAKIQLNKLRNEETQWDSFIQKVSKFCLDQNIEVKKMDEVFTGVTLRPRRLQNEVTNYYHYKVELFNAVIDLVLSELNDRFNERNTELLLCAMCLDPSNDFTLFDKDKLVQFGGFYPFDFSPNDLCYLEHQLDNYVMDMKDQKVQLKGINDVVKLLIQQGKHMTYPLVYKLLKLALLLPVATASVERVFSAMNIIKNRMRNKMSDEFTNDCLVAYIERDISTKIDNETIIKRFQNMKTRRQLI